MKICDFGGIEMKHIYSIKIAYCYECDYTEGEQHMSCSVPALSLKQCKDCEKYATVYEAMYGVKPMSKRNLEVEINNPSREVNEPCLIPKKQNR